MTFEDWNLYHRSPARSFQRLPTVLGTRSKLLTTFCSVRAIPLATSSAASGLSHVGHSRCAELSLLWARRVLAGGLGPGSSRPFWRSPGALPQRGCLRPICLGGSLAARSVESGPLTPGCSCCVLFCRPQPAPTSHCPAAVGFQDGGECEGDS